MEAEKVNYIVIDKRNNYEVDEEENYKNLNNYKKIYEKAKQCVNYKNRIENINKNLLEMMNQKNFRKILGEIENIINERREI